MANRPRSPFARKLTVSLFMSFFVLVSGLVPRGVACFLNVFSLEREFCSYNHHCELVSTPSISFAMPHLVCNNCLPAPCSRRARCSLLQSETQSSPSLRATHWPPTALPKSSSLYHFPLIAFHFSALQLREWTADLLLQPQG